MTKGQTFTYKGKLWSFERAFQYKGSDRVLAAARRWIKSTRKWSGTVLLVCSIEEAERGAQ